MSKGEAREKMAPEKRRGQRKGDAREKKAPEKRRRQRKEGAREKERPEKRGRQLVQTVSLSGTLFDMLNKHRSERQPR